MSYRTVRRQYANAIAIWSIGAQHGSMYQAGPPDDEFSGGIDGEKARIGRRDAGYLVASNPSDGRVLSDGVGEAQGNKARQLTSVFPEFHQAVLRDPLPKGGQSSSH